MGVLSLRPGQGPLLWRPKGNRGAIVRRFLLCRLSVTHVQARTLLHRVAPNPHHRADTSTRASYAAEPDGNAAAAASGTERAPLVRRLTPSQPSCIQTTPTGAFSVTSAAARSSP